MRLRELGLASVSSLPLTVYESCFNS